MQKVEEVEQLRRVQRGDCDRVKREQGRRRGGRDASLYTSRG